MADALAIPPALTSKRGRKRLELHDGFLPLDELATYSGLSRTMLEEFIADPVCPLPHYRFGTKIEVKISEFDAWAFQHHRIANEPLDVKLVVQKKISGR
jgi:hypothetical protein